MNFYKNKSTVKYVAEDLAEAMSNILLNKTASDRTIEVNSEKLLADLNRSSELFEDLGNFKAAEIITKIIEKIAGK